MIQISGYRIRKIAKRGVSVAIGHFGRGGVVRVTAAAAAASLAFLPVSSAFAGPGTINVVLGGSNSGMSQGTGGNSEDPTVNVTNQTGQTVYSLNITGAAGNGAFFNDGDGPGLGSNLSTYDGLYTSGVSVANYGTQTSYMQGSASANSGNVYFIFGGNSSLNLNSGAYIPTGMTVQNGATVLTPTSVSANGAIAAGDVVQAGTSVIASSSLTSATSSDYFLPNTTLSSGTVLGSGNTLSSGLSLPSGTVLGSGNTLSNGFILPGGSTIAAGTTLTGLTLPSNTTITAGTIIPAGASYTYTDPQTNSLVTVTNATSAFTLTATATLTSNLDLTSQSLTIGTGSQVVLPTGVGGNVTLGAALTLGSNVTLGGAASLGSNLTLGGSVTLGGSLALGNSTPTQLGGTVTFTAATPVGVVDTGSLGTATAAGVVTGAGTVSNGGTTYGSTVYTLTGTTVGVPTASSGGSFLQAVTLLSGPGAATSASVGLNNVNFPGLAPGWTTSLGFESLTSNLYFTQVKGQDASGQAISGATVGSTAPLGNSVDIIPGATVGNAAGAPVSGSDWASQGLGQQLNPRFRGGTLAVASGTPNVDSTFTVTTSGGAIDTGGQTVTFNGQIINDAANGGSHAGQLQIASGSHVVLHPTLSGTPTDTHLVSNTWDGGLAVSPGASLSIDSGTALGTGTIALTGSPLGSGTPNPAVFNVSSTTTISNPITVSGDPNYDVATGATATQSGGITDAPGTPPTPGDIVVNGTAGNTGTLIVAPTVAGSNTYTGGTIVSAGTMQMGATNALPTGVAGQAPTLATDGLVTVSTGATFDLANYNTAIGSLAGSGSTTLGTGVLTVNYGSTAYTGNLSGAGRLVVAGGTQTLTGAKTFQGGATVDAGATLSIDQGGALGTGTLALVGGNTVGSTATLATTATTSIGNAITVAGDPTFNVATGTTTTITTGITGTGNVVVDGGGTLVFSPTSVNTYSGGTQIANGSTLQLLGATTAGAPYTGTGLAGTITSNTAGTGGNLVIGDTAGITPNTIQIAGSTPNAGSPAQYTISGLNAVTINQNSTVVGNTGGLIGAVTTTNAGTIDLTGSSTLAFNASGDYVQTSTGTLAVDISSSFNPSTMVATPSSSSLTVAGNATLNGALTYNAALGQYYYGEKFDVLNYNGTLSGAFATVTGNLASYTAVANYGTAGKVYLVLLPVINTGAAPSTTTITNSAGSGATVASQTATGTYGMGGSVNATVVNGAFNPLAGLPTSPTNASGGAILQNVSQAGTATVNQIGSGSNTGVVPGLTVSNVFSATQIAGPSSISDNSSSLTLANGNQLSAAGNLLATGGSATSTSQASGNAVNSLAINSTGATTNTIQQALNQMLASTQGASNSLSASSSVGTSPATLAGGQQSAQALLNTSSVTSGSGSALGVTQSLNDTVLTLSTANSVSATGSASTLAPQTASQVNSIGQTASVQGNLLTSQGGSVSLTGGQNSTLFGTVNLSNSASANTASGAAAVSAPTQSANLLLNNVSSNGSVTAGDATSSPFQQNYQDIGYVKLAAANNGTTTSGGTTALNLNQLSASSGSGAATISAASGAPAQAINLGLNNVSSASSVGGSLLQTTAAIQFPGLANAANATSSGASAVLSGVSQSQNQIVNAVGGAGASAGLQLVQTTPSGMPLSAINSQNASATSGNVVTANAAQSTSLGTNVAALGSLGAANLLQNASASSFTSANALNATGVAATIQNAVQTSATQTNIVK